MKRISVSLWLLTVSLIAGIAALIPPQRFNPKEIQIVKSVPWKKGKTNQPIPKTDFGPILRLIKAKGMNVIKATPKLELSTRRMSMDQSSLTYDRCELVDGIGNVVEVLGDDLPGGNQGRVTLYWNPQATGPHVIVFKGRTHQASEVKLDGGGQSIVNSIPAETEAQLPIVIQSLTNIHGVWHVVSISVPKGLFVFRSVEVSRLD